MVAITLGKISEIDARALLRRTGVQPPPGYTTPEAVTRALRSRAAGGEPAELDHEPVRQLHRRRQSLDNRLELERQEQPITQETHEQQEANQQRPAPIEEAWVYIDEVVRSIIDQVVSESESDEEVWGKRIRRRSKDKVLG